MPRHREIGHSPCRAALAGDAEDVPPLHAGLPELDVRTVDDRLVRRDNNHIGSRQWSRVGNCVKSAIGRNGGNGSCLKQPDFSVAGALWSRGPARVQSTAYGLEQVHVDDGLMVPWRAVRRSES